MPYTQAELLDALHELIQTTGRPVPVGFDRFRAAPPSARYIDANDRLFIQSWNSQITDNGPIAIVLRGRILTPDGKINTIRREHVPATDRTRTFTDFPIQEGYLLSLTVLAQGFTPVTGACFVQVGLSRGADIATEINEVLISEYLHKRRAISWPGNTLQSFLDPPGNLRFIAGTNPAAGAEITETVPTGAHWRLHSIRAQLVTSAVAANREPDLQIDAGAVNQVYYDSGEVGIQLASQTRTYTWAPAGDRHVQSSVAENLLPTPIPLLLPGGHRIRTNTTGLQAGDDWGTPAILVEEWIADDAI